jgi:hypothetical protein
MGVQVIGIALAQEKNKGYRETKVQLVKWELFLFMVLWYEEISRLTLV